MSSVHTSLSNVEGFINAINDLRYNIEDSLRTTVDYANTAENRGKAEISKVNGFIKDMNNDLALIQEILEHNENLACELEEQAKALEKQLAQAQANLESAQSAESAARSSSSGSTEAEKKAHDNAVASAGKAVSSASSQVSSVKSELSRVNNTLNRIYRAIRQLNNVAYEIKRERAVANDFITDTNNLIWKMQDKVSSLNSVASRATSDCDELKYKAERAKNYLSDSLDLLADASGNSSREDELDMSSVSAVLEAANILEKIKSETEDFAERQRDRACEFEEIMGDGISASMAVRGEEIANEMKRTTSSFNEKAEYLRKAYEKLTSYLSCY